MKKYVSMMKCNKYLYFHVLRDFNLRACAATLWEKVEDRFSFHACRSDFRLYDGSDLKTYIGEIVGA